MRLISLKSIFIVTLFFCFTNSFAQSIDSASIEIVVKANIYLDNYEQMVHSYDEIRCFLLSNNRVINIKYLDHTGYENFKFIVAYISATDDTISGFDCNFSISLPGKLYYMAFDTKHKLMYKLKGFYCNDINKLFSDVVYFNQEKFIGIKDKKKFFLKNYHIKDIDLSLYFSK